MALREIDERASDSLVVTLYWQDDDNTLVVDIEDRICPEASRTITGIPPDDRKRAFEHPFAYGKAPV